MRRSSTPITLELDASNLGEIRAAVAELADLPDDTFVTFTAAIELKITQIGSRATAMNAYPNKRDDEPATGIGKPNRAQRRAAR